MTPFRLLLGFKELSASQISQIANSIKQPAKERMKMTKKAVDSRVNTASLLARNSITLYKNIEGLPSNVLEIIQKT